jgi:uncharacterized protein with PQ loop repeat
MPHANAVAENVCGTIGAVLWSIQIIPQIWKSYRTKDTEGLSTMLMLCVSTLRMAAEPLIGFSPFSIWACAGLFLGTYAIVQNINIPIIVCRPHNIPSPQPHILIPSYNLKSSPFSRQHRRRSASTTTTRNPSNSAGSSSSASVSFLEHSKRE